MTPVIKHIHKLRKHKYKSGVSVFFCTLPDCSYKNEVPFVLGKETICNICGRPFIITEYTLKLVKPHCPDCGKMQVKMPDGTRHYVQKVNNAEIMKDIAADETNALKDRLAKVTFVTMPTAEADEDI